MATGRNADGTIDVRVVLTVTIDPNAYVENVMGEHPQEVLVTEVRRNVKTRVRELLLDNSETLAIRAATVQGIYPQEVC